MTTTPRPNTRHSCNELSMETALETILTYYQDLPDGEAPDLLDAEDQPVTIKRLRTYRDVGLLTNNKGIVVTMSDGSEFQVQVVQSK